MDVETYNYNFDIVELQNAVDNLLQQVPMHKHHNQISLKHTELDYEKDLWYEGTGSLTYKFGENFIVDGKLVENEIKLKQHQFTVLNKQLNVSEQRFSLFPMLWANTHPGRLQTRLFRV